MLNPEGSPDPFFNSSECCKKPVFIYVIWHSKHFLEHYRNHGFNKINTLNCSQPFSMVTNKICQLSNYWQIGDTAIL